MTKQQVLTKSKPVSRGAGSCVRMRRVVRALGLCGLAGGMSGTALVSIVWLLFPVPLQRLENWPSSPVVTDRDGKTLARLVGHDDQWRIPVPIDEMSPWLIQATIAAEDARYWQHPGIDGFALLRAVRQNVMAGRVISGASTLSMQLCRMLDDQPRSWFTKLVDAVRAVQIEQLQSKEQIVESYLNVAPYGGNIRGVEAASLLYFGKRARDLSLGEAALLAGIPQQPSRLRPDGHLPRALKRRDYVLDRMAELGFISTEEAHQVRDLPLEIHRERSGLPPQVAAFALQRRPQGGQLAIDSQLQQLLDETVAGYQPRLPAGSDISVVLIDIATGELRALVGSADPADPVDGQINGVVARRSPGSALKPFLYAAAFESRRLRPDSLVADDPETFADWTPDNFDRNFAGRLTAGEALRASRNIPAIHVTQAVGLDRCIGVLEACGVSLPPDAHRRGGLTLAVGGIEVTLLELTNAYATLGRHGRYTPTKLFLREAADVRPMRDRIVGSQVTSTHTANQHSHTIPTGTITLTTPTATFALPPDVCAAINDTLSCRRRHPHGLDLTAQMPWFMWKTGTSSGRRDAWAIGHNHRYAIGVWIGRFSGAGHHDFVGRDAAEPLLARLFCHPDIRTDQEPSALELWPVVDPLPLPDTTTKPPAITSPISGEVFIAVDGQTVVHPRTNRDLATSHWFLNDRFLGTVRPERLSLPRGSYELRCVTDTGRILATKFRVD